MSTAPEYTVNLEYKPAPLLQRAYDAIQNAFPRGSIRISYGSDQTYTQAYVEKYQAPLTHMAILAELAYTNGKLDKSTIDSIIEENLPITLLPEDKQKSRQILKRTLSVKDELSPQQCQKLAEALDFFKEKENVIVNYDRQAGQIHYEAKQEDVLKALEATIPAIVRTLRQQDNIDRNEVRKTFKQQYTANVRSSRTKAKERINAAKKVRISGHKMEVLTELEGQELISLAFEALDNNRSAKAFRTQFSKFGGAVVPVHKDDGTPAFEVYFPIYVNSQETEKGEHVRQHLHRALKQLAKDFATGNHRFISEKLAEDAISQTRKDAPAPVKSTTTTQQKAQGRRLNHFTVALDSLNSKPANDFAEYLLHDNRASALQAFAEREDLAFTVRVKKAQDGPHRFELTFNTDSENMSMSQMTLAHYLLARLRMKWEDGKKIDKAFVREFLETALWDIQHEYSQNALGDKISTVFTKVAGQDRLSFSMKEPEAKEDGKPAEEPEVNLVQVTSYSGNRHANPVEFTLAPWEEDEDGLFIRETDSLGKETKIYPTKNQLKYIEALRNQDVQSILLHGETGTGKTYWAARVALEMLQHGAINKFFYERATVTVGRRQFNPYRKGGDTSIYSKVLEDAIKKHLGHGDLEKGEDTFNALTKMNMLERYDQMYRRGDNLDGAFLLLDEAQGKDEEEIFHIISRPKGNSKVVLVGDHKRQNDLGEMSGFAREFKIFSDPKITQEAVRRLKKMGIEIDSGCVRTMTMGVEDISRSPYTAYIVAAHDIFDELYGETENTPANDHAEQPHPSDRYATGPKIPGRDR